MSAGGKKARAVDPSDLDNDDEHQEELGQASFADMLLDIERNNLYDAAIKRTIATRLAAGLPPPVVLDIGTGTGLLAMMAVRAGAQRVVACEVFKPMAAVAKLIARENGMGDKISVFGKHSTDLKLSNKADMLITEIFDTELIGEGILAALEHAQQKLLKPQQTPLLQQDQPARFDVVPGSATMVGQLVHCPALEKWSHYPLKSSAPHSSSTPQSAEPLPPQKFSDWTFAADQSRHDVCPSITLPHSTQLDRLADNITAVSPPFALIEFDFTRPVVFGAHGVRKNAVQVALHADVPEDKRECHALVVWWVLHLDSETHLSTAPCWIPHTSTEPRQWRDHWMQNAYVLPRGRPRLFAPGSLVTVEVSHDLYAIHCHVSAGAVQSQEPDRPLSGGTSCTCDAHNLCGREQLWLYNDTEKMGTVWRWIDSAISRCPETVRAVALGDMPHVAGMIASTALRANKTVGQVQVVSLAPHQSAIPSPSAVARQVLFANQVGDVVSIQALEDTVNAFVENPVFVPASLQDRSGTAPPPSDSARRVQWYEGEVDVVAGIPYYSDICIPHETLFRFRNELRELAPLLSPTARVLPQVGRLMAVVVQLDELWKSHGEINGASGFTMAALKSVRQASSKGEYVYNMHEYGFVALSQPQCLMRVDFQAVVGAAASDTTSSSPVQHQCQLNVDKAGVAHAILTWLEYGVDNVGDIQFSPLVSTPHCYVSSLRFIDAFPSVTASSILTVSAAEERDNLEFAMSWN